MRTYSVEELFIYEMVYCIKFTIGFTRSVYGVVLGL